MTTATESGTIEVLHLGCGRVGRDLVIQPYIDGSPAELPVRITTLDQDPTVNPDLVVTLGVDAIPLADDSIDLVVARHVLEHIGRQGETAEWFHFWADLYRVMKEGGRVEFESPLWSSVWCWADPTHTRALSEQAFVYLNQDAYRVPGSAISPFRLHCDFVLHGVTYVADGNEMVRLKEPYSHFRGVLVARKPLRVWWA